MTAQPGSVRMVVVGKDPLRSAARHGRSRYSGYGGEVPVMDEKIVSPTKELADIPPNHSQAFKSDQDWGGSYGNENRWQSNAKGITGGH